MRNSNDVPVASLESTRKAEGTIYGVPSVKSPLQLQHKAVRIEYSQKVKTD